jgi:hypothetical protein
MRTAFASAQEAVDVGGIPIINFSRWTEFQTCLQDVLQHKSPDYSTYDRQEIARVQAYLEHQLHGISVSSTMDQHLEERSKRLRQEEIKLRPAWDLRRVGFR